MKKIDYLKYSLKNYLPKERDWFRRAFCVIKDFDEEKFLKSDNMYNGRIFNNGFKLIAFIDNNKVEIDDADVNSPLYSYQEIIKIDSSWNINTKESLETTVGRLVYNYLRLFLPFNNKIDYINKEIKISDLEDIIASKIIDNPVPGEEKDPNAEGIYVDEYLYFLRSSRYLRSNAEFITIGSTPKSISVPTGFKEFKQSLLQKYGDDLKNPVKLAEYETELLKFDDNFLKGDPSYGTSISGKVKNVARKKMYMGVGYERGFSNDIKVNPILNSLIDGWSKDPDQFVNNMNAARVGSYDRGMGTVDGGVAASLLIRATDNFVVQYKDCGTKLGIKRIYTNKNIKKLVGRYVITEKELVYVDNENLAREFVNKNIIVRSPAFCKVVGESICNICLGEKLSRFENGMGIAATEVSSIILYIRMAAMHGSSLNTVKLNINEYFS